MNISVEDALILIYEQALKEIAHYGYQSHGYAVEMQQIAERAINEGRKIRKDCQ